MDCLPTYYSCDITSSYTSTYSYTPRATPTPHTSCNALHIVQAISPGTFTHCHLPWTLTASTLILFAVPFLQSVAHFASQIPAPAVCVALCSASMSHSAHSPSLTALFRVPLLLPNDLSIFVDVLHSVVP
jgi:hypothetical protein